MGKQTILAKSSPRWHQNTTHLRTPKPTKSLQVNTDRKPRKEAMRSREICARAFDDVTEEPCPVCLELARAGVIQAGAVMPLPKFPALLRQDGRRCCRDCQATETTMAAGFQHPKFGSARLTIANERVEGLRMPLGMMEHFGLCLDGWIRPSSIDDLDLHIRWLKSKEIPDSCSLEPF